MSILSNHTRKHPLTAVIANMGTSLTTSVAPAMYSDSGNSICSLEGLDDNALNTLATDIDSVTETMKEVLGESIESLTEAEKSHVLTAAAITAVASANSDQYLSAFKRTSVTTHLADGETVINGASFESADYMMEDASFEAFDNSNLDNFRNFNVVFNALSAIADPFSEAFYPTHTVAPGETGFSLSIKQEVILKETKRNMGGKVTNFGKTRILDAMKDATILECNATECIPAVLPDASNESFFVPKDLMPYQDIEADGQVIKTSALSIHKKVDLISISSGYGEIAGQETNYTDQLDPRLSLKKIVFKLTKAGVNEAIELDVQGLPQTDFTPKMNGQSRAVQLAFTTDRLALNATNGMTVKGDASALLKPAFDAGYGLFVQVTMTAEGSLEYGFVDPMAKCSFGGAVKDGIIVAQSDSALTTALDGVTIAVEGYRTDARRTNSNLRNRGTTADTTSRKQHYVLPFGAPLHVQSPADGSSNSGVGLSTLLNLATVRTSNNSVSALFRQAAQLKAHQEGQVVEGIAAHVLNPTYIEETFDAMKLVNAETSVERAEALKAALVDMIRSMSYDMIRDSGYKTALDLESGNKNSKVELIIGTDETIIQHLMITGDDRTMSVGVDKFTIVTTPDTRMYDTIFIALGCGREAGIDAMNHGIRGYMPAPTIEARREREGAYVNEIIVRPRDFHVNNVPVLAKINVKNLREFLGRKDTVIVSEANQPAKPEVKTAAAKVAEAQNAAKK